MGFGAFRGESSPALGSAYWAVFGVCWDWVRENVHASWLLESLRGFIQAVAALLSNIHLLNFIKGGNVTRVIRKRYACLV